MTPDSSTPCRGGHAPRSGLLGRSREVFLVQTAATETIPEASVPRAGTSYGARQTVYASLHVWVRGCRCLHQFDLEVRFTYRADDAEGAKDKEPEFKTFTFWTRVHAGEVVPDYE